jgi:hypothetical protein
VQQEQLVPQDQRVPQDQLDPTEQLDQLGQLVVQVPLAQQAHQVLQEVQDHRDQQALLALPV